jgi:hypothetical protein
LRLGPIALFFEPLNQVQRVNPVPTRKRAGLVANRPSRKRALEQGHDAGNDERGRMRNA